jgi:hypothetical protein
LEELPNFDEEAAAVAAQLDALQFGNAFRFANELEIALMSNQRTLESRQSEARKQLPGFSQELYRQVRSSNDEDYARKVESEAKEQARLERVRQEKEERSKLTKSAVTDADGYLQGFNIKDESGKVIRFEKVKRVPISS